MSSLRSRAAGAAALLSAVLLAGCGEEPPPTDVFAPGVDRPASAPSTSASGTPKAGGLEDDRSVAPASPGKRERRLQGSASKLAGDGLDRRSR